jgi:beta-glucosidase
MGGGTDATATGQDIRERAEALLGRMTAEEKAGQLTQYFYFGFLRGLPPGSSEMAGQPEMVEAALARGEAGSLLFVQDAADSNRLQRLALAGNRHGIPVLFGFDVVHGLRTILPVPIALAASWDPAAVERAQAVAAREARAVGIHWTFAPVVDIARDPRWGRSSRAPARTRTWPRRSAPPRSAASRAVGATRPLEPPSG